MAAQGLRLGGNVGLPVYAYKDQFASFVPMLLVVPNARDQYIIAHVYLDLIENSGGREFLTCRLTLGIL